MADVHIDHISTLSCQERFGAITRLVRRARVVGLTETDFTVLFEALEEAGVPAAGSLLETLALPPPHTPLVLTERNVTLVDNDKGVCDVDLTYESVLNEGQNLNTPIFGGPVSEVEATVQQTTSNLDVFGDLIVVRHTYPSTDPDYPNQLIEQGGEITYFQPQYTLRLSGIKAMTFPSVLGNSVLGHINSDANWAGGDIHTWLCTAASWKIHDYQQSYAPNAIRWMFKFEFQYNPDTWDPTVGFIDNRTGKPPPNLVQGSWPLSPGGYMNVQKHPAANFSQLIGTVGGAL